jgi:hypothetical protein
VTLRAQLQEIRDQRQSAAPSLTTTVVVGDSKLYQLLPGRVNADGLKSLKECLKTESRHHRICERKRLIPDDSRVLITQTLAALGLVPEKEPEVWESWTDEKIFEEMSKVYPSGKGQAYRLQDDLKQKNCDWYLDTSQATLQLFITAINEAMLNHRGEIAEAEKNGTAKFLEKECVRILLSRITAGNADVARQPQAVRVRLKARCLMAGEPQDVQTLISRQSLLLTPTSRSGCAACPTDRSPRRSPYRGPLAEARTSSTSSSTTSSSSSSSSRAVAAQFSATGAAVTGIPATSAASSTTPTLTAAGSPGRSRTWASAIALLTRRTSREV